MSDCRYWRASGSWLVLAWAGWLLMLLPGCGASTGPQATAQEGGAAIVADKGEAGGGEAAARPAADDPSGRDDAEIGRASCRERVYVLV